MDDADRSDDKIQNTIADGIAECRRKPVLIPVLACYNCGDSVPQHHLFCSSDCSADYAHRVKREKDQGL
ncbi:MAG: DUF2116 family Zn-ribbon domain-containing protein [Gallionella sp.]|jgi:hypothetical protein